MLGNMDPEGSGRKNFKIWTQYNTPIFWVNHYHCLWNSSLCRWILLDEVRYVFLVAWILTLFQIDWNDNGETTQKAL